MDCCNGLHCSIHCANIKKEMDVNPLLSDIALGRLDLMCAQAQLTPSSQWCNVYFACPSQNVSHPTMVGKWTRSYEARYRAVKLEHCGATASGKALYWHISTKWVRLLKRALFDIMKSKMSKIVNLFLFVCHSWQPSFLLQLL